MESLPIKPYDMQYIAKVICHIAIGEYYSMNHYKNKTKDKSLMDDTLITSKRLQIKDYKKGLQERITRKDYGT